jgi:hypothetical protein
MKKIYTIGDIHGDYDKLYELLNKHNIVEDSTWIADDSTLICIGDLMDRGKNGLAVLDLIMNLEKQALAVGGNVISLMGNHDAIMIAMASIINEEFEERDCYDVFIYNGGFIHEAENIAANKNKLDWLKNRPLMHKQNNILFQHADTAKYYLSFGNNVEEIKNNGLKLSQSGDGAWNVFFEMTDSRFWDNANGDYINQYLNLMDVNKIVHGHTRFVGSSPQFYFDNKIVNVDGSMSCGYRNDPDRGFIVVFDENGNIYS